MQTLWHKNYNVKNTIHSEEAYKFIILVEIELSASGNMSGVAKKELLGAN